jgi:serine/threonine protein kinase/tetratricopeptide (TPR) repeat protein
MNAEESAQADEPLTPWLVAGDQALAAGRTPAEAAAAVAPPELRAELERGLAYAQMLRQVLPRRNAADPAGPAPTPPLTHLGRFEIRRELGRGAFGMVFLAHDPCLGREVALKVPRPDALVTPELRERFFREARATAGLDHPNLVPVYETGEVGPICFIASAYCPGVTLAAWLRKRTEPVPVRLAAQLVATLAAAVEYAHRHGVVHRDLKPSNVLLQWRSEPRAPSSGPTRLDAAPTGPGPRDAEWDFVPKVTDFGLAKLTPGAPATTDAAGEPTQSGMIMGTPTYMAPEQASGRSKAVGPAADVYAVGIILYELLVGRAPFQGETVLDTLEQVRSYEPVPPRRWRPKLPRDLETICLKCLQKEPGKRYASAAALADDLRRFLAGMPIQARPVRVWERGVKWAQRRPTAAALVGVTLLALAGGVTGVLWYAQWERDRAKQESALRREADDQREQAQAVLKFFEDHMLAAARPQGQEGGLGEDATIRAAVEAAEPKIAGAFHDRPLVEAAIRNTLGLTYWYLRESKAAIAQHERALGLRHDQLGPDHPHTLASMNNLALAYKAAGQLEKALPLFEQTLAQRQEKLGPDHPDTLTCMNNLASAYKAVGQLAKAVPLYEQTLAKRQEKFGPDHPRTLGSMNNLAMAYKAAGQLDKALPLLQQALAKWQEKLGPDHPHTLGSMNNLALAYQAVGELAEAVPLYEQALAKRQEKFGPDHPRTLRSMGNLALAYQAVGQHGKAVPLCEQALAKQQEKLGPDHPHTLTSMNNLAMAYQAVGQHAKAVTLYEQALAKRQEKLGPDHPRTLTSMNSLAMAYQAAGRLDQALPLLRQALAKRQEKLGPDHPHTLGSMNNLALAYQSVGQLDKALPLLQQALAKRQEKLGPDHPSTLTTMASLAAAYLAAQQPDKALPLIHDSLAAQRRRLGPDHAALAGLLASVGQDLLKYGHYTEAEKALRECLTIRETKLPDDWSTFNAKSLLGGSLLGQQHYADAEPLLIQGWQGMLARAETIPAPAKVRLTEARERLVQLYEAWGKPEQAAQWRAALPKPAETKP